MKNKKGMEIAISTLVGIIIGAMMLFAGIALLTTILSRTQEVYGQIDAQMREEVLNAFVRDDAIYIHRNPVSPRRSEDAVFGIGLQNIRRTTKNFTIHLLNEDDFNTEEYKVAYLLPGDDQSKITLNPRQKEVFFIIVPTMNLERGQHTLTLRIEYYDEDEGQNVHYKSAVLYVNK